MARDQTEDLNTFGRHRDRPSRTERIEMERAALWSLYLNGGGGSPFYFDYPAYIRGIERQATLRER